MRTTSKITVITPPPAPPSQPTYAETLLAYYLPQILDELKQLNQNVILVGRVAGMGEVEKAMLRHEMNGAAEGVSE